MPAGSPFIHLGLLCLGRDEGLIEKEHLRPLLDPEPAPQAFTSSTHNKARKQSEWLPIDVQLIFLLTKITCGAIAHARRKHKAGRREGPLPHGTLGLITG